jgi:copper(I)-binding protein
MRLPAFLFALCALAGCGSGSTHNSVAIANPTIRLAAVSGQPAAGYVKVAATPDRGALIGISSPRAERVEMHETVARGTMSSMRPVERIDLAEEGEIVFATGGRHLMLIGVDPALKPGDRADLTFRFAHGDPVTASARVIGAGDDVAH